MLAAYAFFGFGKRPALHRISGVFGFGFTQASHNISGRPDRGTGEHRAKNVFKFGLQPLPSSLSLSKHSACHTL